MSGFVVHENAIAGGGGAVHALVIGIGDYPHLIGGSGPLTPSHDGMQQLSSPPVSARAVADWLIADFRHPEHEIGFGFVPTALHLLDIVNERGKVYQAEVLRCVERLKG